jgi:hypothetical protein
VIPGAYESVFFESNMEEDGGDVSDEEEDDEPPEDGEVVIRFPCELKQKIRALWCTSLIVKVFGRSVGYVFLVNKLKNMWKTSGNFSCVDLGLGFFLIRFESKEGFEDVLKGGPWFIGEHFLSHRPWVPNFRASEASISSVAVWVRLPKLPVEYYHNDSLLWIGSGLGPVLRVDFNTAAGTRGRFERLCIQLDIDKPLARTVRVGKTRLVVIYEGVGLLCFHCGKIGHRWEWCPNLAPEETEKSPVNDQSRSGMEEDNKLKGFGPWMLVTRRKRQTKPAGGSELNSDTPSCNTRSGDHGIGGTGIDMPSAQRRDSHANRFKYSHLEKGKKAQSNGLRDNVNIGPAGFKSLSNNVGPSDFISNPIVTKIPLQSQPLDPSSSFTAKPNFNSSIQPPSSLTIIPPPSSTISLQP